MYNSCYHAASACSTMMFTRLSCIYGRVDATDIHDQTGLHVTLIIVLIRLSGCGHFHECM